VTFIFPPFFKHFTQPRLWLRLLAARARTRYGDFSGEMMARLASIPPAGFRPQLRLDKKALVPAARAAHRALSDALARGDLTALRRVAMPPLFSSLAARVQRRPRRRRLEWQLVRYTAPARLLQHSIERMPVDSSGTSVLVTRQAIVAVASRQRLVEYDDADGGAVVSEKEVDLTENVIIMAFVDPHTYKTGEWKVWGFGDELKLKDYEKAQEVMVQLRDAQVAKQRQKLRSAS